jgi:hypothetical protein
LGGEGGGDGELIVELTLTLEGARGVHDLESQALAGGEGCLVDGAESTVAEEGGGGERGGGALEEGVGEAALVVVEGGWCGCGIAFGGGSWTAGAPWERWRKKMKK